MIRLILFILSLMVCAGAVHAQSCRIEMIGKPVQTYNEGGNALDAVVRPSLDLSVVTDDASGNIYFYDEISKRILKISTDGTIHTVAGTGQAGTDGDGGPATHARIVVRSLTASPDGVLYFSDQSRIRRIGRDGIIQTVAGTGKAAFNLDSGAALSVHLNLPQGLHYGKDQHLYFADQRNNRIRKLTPDGQVITIAGSSRPAQAWSDGKYVAQDEGENGPAIKAYVPSPRTVFLLPDGQVIWQDSRADGKTVRKIRIVDNDGKLKTLYSDTFAIDLDVDPQGRIYVGTIQGGIQFRKQIHLDQETENLWRPEERIPQKNIPGITFRITSNIGLPSGRVFQLGTESFVQSDLHSYQIWIEESGELRHVAGKTLKLPPIQDGPLSAASFPTPADVYFDQQNGFYFLDQKRQSIYRVSSQKQIRKFFGGNAQGDPDGKHPLSVEQHIYAMAASGPDEIVAVMSNVYSGGFSIPTRLYRITPEKITAIHSADGKDITFSIPSLLSNKPMAVDRSGTIYILSGAGSKTDVLTIDSQRRLHRYSMNGSYYAAKTEDGRVIAASSQAFPDPNFYVYYLTASGPGSRVPELEGAASIAISPVGDDVFIQNSVNTFFFRKSMKNGQWRKILIDQAVPDSFGIGQFVGFGWNQSLLFISSAGLNLVRLVNPENCPSIPGPEVAESALVNSANYARPGVIAPGQLLSLWGKNLGPEEGYGFDAGPSGGIVYSSIGTSLKFRYDCSPYICEYPAPLIFGNDSQSNLQMAITSAPLKGKSFEAYLNWENVYIPFPGTLKFVSTNPGLFVINGGRDGQGAILNQNGSVNSATNPASIGSVISLYGTGLGEYEPSYTFNVMPVEAPVRLKANIVARIGGKPAEVLYAGGSPGSVAGLNQINVRIPEGVSGTEVEVEIDADGASTSGTQRVTLAVQ